MLKARLHSAEVQDREGIKLLLEILSRFVAPSSPPEGGKAYLGNRTSENSVMAKFSIAPARRMNRPGQGGRRGVL